MTSPQQQVISKCKEVIEKARTLYNVDLSVVRIQFNLKGRAAGWASYKNGIYTCRFNAEMITRGDPAVLKDMLEDTVPHELAHIVCFMRRDLGRNHNTGWYRVCRALGGTGKTTHDLEVVNGKGYTYEYITDRGHKVRIGDKHHREVQAGNQLIYRKGKGTIHRMCAYSIVGYQGQLLKTPIVKNAPTTPAETTGVVRSMQPVAAPVQQPVQQPPSPAPAPLINTGESKAAVSRRIMLAGYNRKMGYEDIISAMIMANGYNRQLARATFKANAPKVGIPSSFYE
jgi:SprT protein